MKSLSDLLSKYKNLKPTDSIKKDALISVLDTFYNIRIEKNNITISNNIYYLKVSPALKSEIYLNKLKLIIALKKILAAETPRDII